MADPMLAEIKLFGESYAPQNWAYCWGQLLAINEYTKTRTAGVQHNTGQSKGHQ